MVEVKSDFSYSSQSVWQDSIFHRPNSLI